MNEIILNGVSISELKRQQALILKDAAKFIADNMVVAQKLMQEVLDADTAEIAAEKAKEATEILKNISIVSDVSSCKFYLPYNTEYDSENVFSVKMTNMMEEDIAFDIPELSALYETLESMEGDSSFWHAFNC